MSDQNSTTNVGNLQLRANVRGRVQGVGYRQFVLRTALELGLMGWVRNDQMTRDRVEVEAQGTQAQLEQLLIHLWRGPFGAKVNEIATQWSAISQPFEGFQIR